MALRTPPSWLQNGSHPAENDRLTTKAIWQTSGIVNPTDLQITQNGTPNMSVNASAGYAAVVGTTQANMGTYLAYNDASANITIPTANSSNPRIDIVVVAISDAYYTGTLNTVAFQVVSGTPAASPTAPVIPANSVALCQIAVGTSVTSILTANITDLRVLSTSPFGTVTLTGTQTLTNKTLTSPVLTTPSISNITAKGDLLAGTAASTIANLPVGADGTTLVADSSATTGLRWQVPVNVNPVLNAAMQIAQYGTSTSLAAGGKGYACDRWKAYASNNASVLSRAATGDTTNLPFIQYALRFQRNAGQISTSSQYLAQSLETINSIPYAGKTVTFSFYARKGANFSGSLSAILFSGTGTDQNYIDVAYTGQTVVAGNADITTATSPNPALSTTWQRYTYSGTVATTATELAIVFTQGPTGTAGANDYYEITGVQLEVGSVATPFKTYAGTFQGELAACQRYYYLLVTGNTTSFANANYNSATLMRAFIQFPVPMRTTPSVVSSIGANYYIARAAGGDDFFNSVNFGDGAANGVSVYNNTEISGVAGQGALLVTNNASSSVAFSAEL